MSDSNESQPYDPASHYDRVTAAWGLLLGNDLHYGVFETGEERLEVATNALTELMIDAAHLKAGTSLLDVGCGTGGPACQVAGRFGNRVHGISTSDSGVRAARARAKAAELSPRVTFEVRDAMDSGLPTGAYDRVWALESSHLMPDRRQLVAECARIAASGGRVVICDLVRKRDIPFTEVRARRREFSILRAAFGDAHFGLCEDYERDLDSVGVRVDVVRDLTAATFATFDRWRRNLARHEAGVVEAIGRQGADDFGRSIEILEGLWQDGTLGYALVAGTRF